VSIKFTCIKEHVLNGTFSISSLPRVLRERTLHSKKEAVSNLIRVGKYVFLLLEFLPNNTALESVPRSARGIYSVE
jgi:hypothetical protein